MRNKKNKRNKKKIQSKEKIIDNIKFKSLLEVYFYKKLKENKLTKEYIYEKRTIEIIQPFEFHNEKIRGVKYTPDWESSNCFIEIKGHPNESFPLRFKLFKKYLKDNNINHKVFLLKGKTDINNYFLNLKKNE